MKKIDGFECRATGLGWLGNLAVAFALCLALIAPAVASNRGTLGSPPPPSAADDETVGTLPMLGSSSLLEVLRFAQLGSPSVYLEGSLDEIQRSLASVEGNNGVTLEVLDGAGENVRVTFHGRVRILLDRASIQTGAISVGVMVPARFGSGQAQFWLGAALPAPTGLRPGLLPLPVGSLLARGALNGRALNGLLTSDLAARTSLQVAAGRELVLLTQTH